MSAVMDPCGARAAQCAPIVTPEFLRDPYPTYRRLRHAGRVQWSDEFFGGAWLVARHDDVEAVLRDERFSARRTGAWILGVPGKTSAQRRELDAFRRRFGSAMLFLDAPDHTALRRLLNVGFNAQALQRWSVGIERIADELFDAIDASSPFDFMRAVARPLTVRATAHLLGLDEEDSAQLVEWSDDIARFIGAPAPTLDLARCTARSLDALCRMFERGLRQADAHRRDDLLGLLASAQRDGRLNDGVDLAAQGAMLLLGGHETTRNLLGNGLLALLQRPQGWAELRSMQAAGLPSNGLQLTRELLRYDSPVQYTARRVADDMNFAGTRLKRGQLVVALIGSANRDELRHRAPDELDFARSRGPSLSFGVGPHVCIGAGLTMIEAQAVWRRVSARWPRLQLVDRTPSWNGDAVYRGLATLRVMHANARPSESAIRESESAR